MAWKSCVPFRSRSSRTPSLSGRLNTRSTTPGFHVRSACQPTRTPTAGPSWRSPIRTGVSTHTHPLRERRVAAQGARCCTHRVRRSYGISSVMYGDNMVACADAVKCHGMTSGSQPRRMNSSSMGTIGRWDRTRVRQPGRSGRHPRLGHASPTRFCVPRTAPSLQYAQCGRRNPSATSRYTAPVAQTRDGCLRCLAARCRRMVLTAEKYRKHSQHCTASATGSGSIVSAGGVQAPLRGRRRCCVGSGTCARESARSEGRILG